MLGRKTEKRGISLNNKSFKHKLAKNDISISSEESISEEDDEEQSQLHAPQKQAKSK